MQDLIGVVDQETNAILCFTKTMSCANSVSLGFVNSQVFMLPTSLPWKAKELEGIDLETGHLMIAKGSVSTLPQSLVTKHLLSQKRLALLRARYINSLEVYIKVQASRIDIFTDTSLVPAISQALHDSYPDANNYSASILEYAYISDIPASTAYTELKLMLDTVNTVRIRNLAWYKKYVDIINTNTSVEEMKSTISAFYKDIFSKALL